MLEDIEEKAPTAAKVQYRLRRAAMHFQVLGSYNVQAQPSLYVRIFCVVFGG